MHPNCFISITSVYLTALATISALSVGSLASESGTKTLVRGRRQAPFVCPQSAANDDNVVTNLHFIRPSDGNELVFEHTGGNQTRSLESARLVAREVMKAGFDLNNPVLVYIHSYTHSTKAKWLLEIRENYARMLAEKNSSDHNLLFFDWSSYSQFEYGDSVSYVSHVGRSLGDILAQIVNAYGYDASKMNIIPFSFATHIGGVVARVVSETASGGHKVGAINAMDPTGVCFHFLPTIYTTRNTLRATDAVLVASKHYDDFHFGPHRPIGGLDIYVNGGTNQPKMSEQSPTEGNGTETEEITNHRFAAPHEVGMESDELLTGCQSVAFACRSYSAYLAGECASCGENYSGCYYLNSIGRIRIADRIKGQQSYPLGTRMYIKTGAGPFCLNLHQLKLHLKPNASIRTRYFLSRGLVSIKLGSQVVKVANRVSMRFNLYSALVESSDSLVGLNQTSLIVDSRRPEQDSALVVADFDRVELNYMSRALEEDRVQFSFTLCPSSNSSLTRCER